MKEKESRLSTPTSSTPSPEVSPSSAHNASIFSKILFALMVAAVGIVWQRALFSSPWSSQPTDPTESSTSRIAPVPSLEVVQPQTGDKLQIWDPIAVNYTRRLRLDDSDRIFEMRTVAMDPPIFGEFSFCETIMENMGAVCKKEIRKRRRNRYQYNLMERHTHIYIYILLRSKTKPHCHLDAQSIYLLFTSWPSLLDHL